ncbi:peptidase M19 [Hymenobacter sp. HMF4947]|uniref:Peptidase M19 n=1 Tax=Hymenobacter ginkgonis TaxID=2682976 RepID=A0A7K1T8S1_9BACT|nr:membrane dipeptidase [Hymenobacter ginkgonis]MVN74783.1 peptidase M19 [Hymenobacter ginkgonis]
MKSPSTWSRRDFLVSATGASAALLLNPLATWAIDEVDPRVAALVASTIGIDTHNHIDVPLTTAEIPGPAIDLAGELKKSGLSAICMTFAVDYQELRDPGDAYERFLNGLTSLDQQVQRNGLKRALNLADLQAAHQKHQPTLIQSVEGGHFLEGKLERLQVAYDRGLRHLGLLHDHDASVPLGDVFTNPAHWGGLTAFGADTIRECNRLGILIDLSHANAATVAAALKVTTKPVLVSHTGLDTQLGQDPNMARLMKPRLISKEQAKTVAEAGGVIGVWTHLADSPLAYAQNVRALVDVVGIDHVCIGTDTKLTPAYRPAGGFGPKPGGPTSQPSSAPGTRPNGSSPSDKGPGGPGGVGGQGGGRAGERTNEAWQNQKVGFYYAVVDALLKTGFTADDIGKFGGGNFCRVFGAATAGHR